MSFGEGNLRERCDQYRRQLGGMQAAHNRLKQRVRELESLVRDMHDTASRGEFDVGEEARFAERMAQLGIEARGPIGVNAHEIK